MKKFIERLKRLLTRGAVSEVLNEPRLDRQGDYQFIFDQDAYAKAVKEKTTETNKEDPAPFDHDAQCKAIVENWLKVGVSVTTLTPNDVFYSGQLSESPGPIDLDHKIREYDAGLWLSRHLMYASCYTDFSSAVGTEQIRSKYLFKVRPTFDVKVVVFADGAPHPAPMGRPINGINSDLYIAQQWPRLLNELIRINPEFAGAHGHLRESDSFTSELWLHNTRILTVDKALNVTHEKHWERVMRYGNGSEESEARARVALFDKPSPSLSPVIHQEQSEHRPRQTLR